MSTHKLGFYEVISKIIIKLSSNTHLISTAAFLMGFEIIYLLLRNYCYFISVVQ